MKCELCGKEFRPSGHGRPQRYCSKSCRQKADYRRKKNRPAQDWNSKPPVKVVETQYLVCWVCWFLYSMLNHRPS